MEEKDNEIEVIGPMTKTEWVLTIVGVVVVTGIILFFSI